MPVYTQQCLTCEHVFDDFRVIDSYDDNPLCPKCHTETKRIIARSGAFHAFPAGIWEHINVEGIEIRSKKHLIQECNKRGVAAVGYMSPGSSQNITEEEHDERLKSY